MEKERHESYPRTFSPVSACIRDNPVKDGPEAVFETHIGINHFILLRQGNQRDYPEYAAADEYNERNPDHRAFQKVIHGLACQEFIHIYFFWLFLILSGYPKLPSLVKEGQGWLVQKKILPSYHPLIPPKIRRRSYRVGASHSLKFSFTHS